MWIHEDQDWPNVTWDAETYASKLADELFNIRQKTQFLSVVL